MSTSQTTVISPTDPYLRALCKDQDRERTASYIEKQCQHDTCYTVAKVEYDVFKRYGYQPPRTYGKSAGRRAAHLFNGIWTLGFKMPFHATKAFTVGPCTGTFRTNLYRAGTDFHEGWFGHVQGCVRLSHGDFEVAKSNFHNRCYTIMDASPSTTKEHAKFRPSGDHFDKSEGEFTDFGSAMSDLSARYIGLTQDQLDATPLDKIPSVVLALNCERFYTLNFSEEQLQAIPLAKLAKNQIDGLFPPFNEDGPSSDQGVFAELHQRNIKRTEKKRKKAFTRLRAFSPLELKSIEGVMAPECMKLHRVAMAYNEISKKGLTIDLFDDFDAPIIVEALFTEELEKTIQRLHDIDMEILHRFLPHLPMKVLFRLSTEKLKELDLSLLTEAQLNAFFDTSKKKGLQRLIITFTAKQISAVMSRLSVFQIQTFDFSNEQLQLLDLSKLSIAQLRALLPLYSFSETAGGVQAQMQKKHAEKQLKALNQVDAFTKTEQQAVLQDKLPELWALYQDWKSSSANSQIDAMQKIIDLAIKLPPPKKPESSKKTDVDTPETIEDANKSLVRKAYDFAVWFFRHVHNGACIVANVLTYPLWKPFQIAKAILYPEMKNKPNIPV